MEWEDPHPGRRLMLSRSMSDSVLDKVAAAPESSNGEVFGEASGDGCGSDIDSPAVRASRNDTAAKGMVPSTYRSASPPQQWLSGCQISEHRCEGWNVAPRVPHLPAAWTTTAALDRIPAPRSPPSSSRLPPTSRGPLSPPPPEAHAANQDASSRLSIDTSDDPDTPEPNADGGSIYASTLVSEATITPSACSGKTASTLTHALTDFSHHLHSVVRPSVGPLNDSDDSASAVFTDSGDTLSHGATMDDDMYGWEAELDRKISTQRCAECGCPSRRINGRRRSFFQRMFSGISAGGTAGDSDESHSTSTAASNALDMSVPPVPTLTPALTEFIVMRESHRL